jgi:hypothetical protein
MLILRPFFVFRSNFAAITIFAGLIFRRARKRTLSDPGVEGAV